MLIILGAAQCLSAFNSYLTGPQFNLELNMFLCVSVGFRWVFGSFPLPKKHVQRFECVNMWVHGVL